MFLHQPDSWRIYMYKEEYQRYEKKSRGGDLRSYSKQLLLCLLLSRGLIVFNIESIDIDVNFNFKQAETIEVPISNNKS